MLTKTSTSTASAIELNVVSIAGTREQNEDAALVWRAVAGEVVAVVSDGMGGHEGGREAAEIVVRSCAEAIRRRTADESWDQVLVKALELAHENVRSSAVERQDADSSRGPMGATVVLAILDTNASVPNLHVAHVGDSRAYLCRGRSLIRLTSDHSMVGQMVRDGYLSEEEAFGHPDSNILQRALGQTSQLEADVQRPLPLDEGDVVILCSDGLHGVLDNESMLELIRPGGSAAEISEALVRAALDANSTDNISVACVKFGTPRKKVRPTRTGENEDDSKSPDPGGS